MLLRRFAALLLLVIVLVVERLAHAHGVAPEDKPTRKAPRLEYKRGPVECLPELEFRREVAIAGDGVDRFDATGPDVMRVRFERTAKGYRGTIDFTAADGQKRKSKVQEHANCEILGRWVGTAAAFYFPPRPTPVDAAEPPDPVPSKGPAVWVPPFLPPQHFEPSSPQPPPSSSFWDAVRSMDLTIGLSAYALMTAGLTANVGPGFGIGADVRGEVFSIGVELRGVLPGIAYTASPIDRSAPFTVGDFDLSQLTGLVVPCGRYKYFVGCGVVQGGTFVANSLEGQRLLPAFAFGPRAGLEIPFAERFAVFGFGEALFAPLPVGIDDPPYNVEWTQSIVSGFFGAGLSVNFK